MLLLPQGQKLSLEDLLDSLRSFSMCKDSFGYRHRQLQRTTELFWSYIQKEKVTSFWDIYGGLIPLLSLLLSNGDNE